MCVVNGWKCIRFRRCFAFLRGFHDDDSIEVFARPRVQTEAQLVFIAFLLRTKTLYKTLRLPSPLRNAKQGAFLCCAFAAAPAAFANPWSVCAAEPRIPPPAMLRRLLAASLSPNSSSVLLPHVPRGRMLQTSTVVMGHGSHSSDNDPHVLEKEKQRNLTGVCGLEIRWWRSGARCVSARCCGAACKGPAELLNSFPFVLLCRAGQTPEIVPGEPGWNPALASDSEAAVSVGPAASSSGVAHDVSPPAQVPSYNHTRAPPAPTADPLLLPCATC